MHGKWAIKSRGEGFKSEEATDKLTCPHGKGLKGRRRRGKAVKKGYIKGITHQATNLSIYLLISILNHRNLEGDRGDITGFYFFQVWQ